MAEIPILVQPLSARTIKTVREERDLVAGAKVKCELGNDELSVTVPTGKKWNILTTMYIVETDA